MVHDVSVAVVSCCIVLRGAMPPMRCCGPRDAVPGGAVPGDAVPRMLYGAARPM
jgi:hypothetical protein